MPREIRLTDALVGFSITSEPSANEGQRYSAAADVISANPPGVAVQQITSIRIHGVNYIMAGGMVSAQTAYFGTKTTTDFTPADFTLAAADLNGITLPGDYWPAGERRYMAYLQRMDEGTITAIYYYTPGNRRIVTNSGRSLSRLGTSWELQSSMITIHGTEFFLARTKRAIPPPGAARVIEGAA